MSTNSYAIDTHDHILHDNKTRLLHDTVDEHNAEIDALVASNDCFITLATQLDALQTDTRLAPVTPELEKVIRTLIYLQRHYAIAKKYPNYRQ